MSRVTTPPDIRIATERLLLRSVATADADAIVAGIGDFEVSRMLARVPHPYRHSDALTFIAATRAARGEDIALTVLADGVVIGGLGLTGVRTAREFGYWFAKPAWGKGYATEAGRAFLAWLFADAGVDIVRSGVFHDNPASLNVQRKLGFETIGTHMVRCLARGHDVEHIDTLLTRDRHAALGART
ncbi:MAG: GNAT family N-acetyltransferase [Bauldia sp.]|nr:GNAT family N-acetyltransferase [Bauldia sp.]